MKIVVLIVIMFFSCFGSQEDSKIIVSRFVDALKNENISEDEIIKKFIKVSEVQDAEYRDSVISNIIISIRKSIKGKKVEVYTFREKTEAFKNVIHENDSSEMLVLFTDNEVLTYVLVEDNMLASFSTINKGGKRHYVYW
ncbi:hypothetical protein JKA74_10485 [Marivirga sp. S37H4]|uniref:Uncharacterized protein n=1 Tax=Marivirga aurantiaca TaxID=2802615 RepID=A0A935C8I1_9BACT|nr:hypothetical protein [Marivirga aurantiaca]MBK6265464.1 hypothetical protein [Marivirga aurantiaca]